MAQDPSKKTDEEPVDELPVWHIKRHKSYRVHRVLMVIQICVALFLAFVIWYGTRVFLP